MSSEANVIYSAHHANTGFGKFSDRVALERGEQRIRYSDYYSGMSVPHGVATLRSNYSRGLVDLNRPLSGHKDLDFVMSEDLFPTKDFGRPHRRDIWIPGQEPTVNERIDIHERVYRGYMKKLLKAVEAANDRPTIVVAWDSSSEGPIGVEPDGSERVLPSIILSNDGNRNSGGITDKERERGIVTTCDPKFLEELATQLRITLEQNGLPNDVRLNYLDDVPNDEVGGIVRTFNTHTNPDLKKRLKHSVDALQVEYNAQMLSHYDTLKFDKQKAVALRIAFETAMNRTYLKFFSGLL